MEYILSNLILSYHTLSYLILSYQETVVFDVSWFSYSSICSCFHEIPMVTRLQSIYRYTSGIFHNTSIEYKGSHGQYNHKIDTTVWFVKFHFVHTDKSSWIDLFYVISRSYCTYEQPTLPFYYFNGCYHMRSQSWLSKLCDLTDVMYTLIFKFVFWLRIILVYRDSWLKHWATQITSSD